MTDDAPPDAFVNRPQPRLAGIIWGAAKTGKTTYAASSPGRKFIINLDPEGWLAVDYRDDLGAVWDYSLHEPKSLIAELTSDKLTKLIEDSDIQPGDTVLFDSVTMFNQAALMTAIAKGIGSGERGFTPSIETPGLAAYGARTQYLIAAMGKVIRATGKKNAHLWFLAHEDTPEKDKQGNFLYQSILMSENAINQASASISEIWRMTGSDNSRVVWLRSTTAYRPMGSRIFRMDEANQFKLKYDIDKPDDKQPHAISSLWQAYLDGGRKKLHVPT